jgi:exopolysaccharide biosynthesis polyprenyl glycosylphosphotransferase
VTTQLEELTLLPERLEKSLDAGATRVLSPRRKAGFVKGRGWLVQRSLIAADVLALAGSFAIVLLLMGRLENRLGTAAELAVFCISLPVWVFVAGLYGLYARDAERTDHTTADDFAPIFHLVTTGTWLVFVATRLSGAGVPHISRLAIFWGLAIALIIVLRAVARGLYRGRDAFRQNTVIVGTDETGQLLAKKLLSHPECGINVVGFVDTPRHRIGDLGNLPLLGTPDELPEIVRELDVERVVIAFSGQGRDETTDLIRMLSNLGIQIDIVPRFPDVVEPRIDTYSVEGITLFGLRPVRLSRTARTAKRTIDIAGAAAVLALMTPVLAVVAVMIRLDSPGPVFYRQLRVGASGRYFRIWKFRTMLPDADDRKAEVAHLNHHLHNGDPRLFKIHDDPRVTRVGRFLRRHYLDEFPQLINVLSGDMSLVGPRPLILSEAEHVGTWALSRLNLKPGMTGLWQVLGGSAISFGEMVKLDYLYVSSWSLWNDIRLLSQTIPVVFRGARSK